MVKRLTLAYCLSLVAALWQKFNDLCLRLSPVGDLLIRAWVGKAFFVSGFERFQSWPSTLLLFTYEHHVAWLSPVLAAYLATYLGFFASIFLILGLGGRLPALVLFLFNVVMVLSYPFFWTKAGYIGLLEQTYFAMLLMIMVLQGPDRLSVDYCIRYWKQPGHIRRALV